MAKRRKKRKTRPKKPMFGLPSPFDNIVKRRKRRKRKTRK